MGWGTPQKGHADDHTAHSFSTALETTRAWHKLACQLDAAKPCPVWLQWTLLVPPEDGSKALTSPGHWAQPPPTTTRALCGDPVVAALQGLSGRGASGRGRMVAVRSKGLSGWLF